MQIYSRIDIIPVPTTANFEGSNEQITSNVSSMYLRDYVLNMAATVPEDPKIDLDTNINGGQNNTETNNNQTNE